MSEGGWEARSRPEGKRVREGGGGGGWKGRLLLLMMMIKMMVLEIVLYDKIREEGGARVRPCLFAKKKCIHTCLRTLNGK